MIMHTSQCGAFAKRVLLVLALLAWEQGFANTDDAIDQICEVFDDLELPTGPTRQGAYGKCLTYSTALREGVQKRCGIKLQQISGIHVYLIADFDGQTYIIDPSISQVVKANVSIPGGLDFFVGTPQELSNWLAKMRAEDLLVAPTGISVDAMIKSYWKNLPPPQ